VKRRTPAGTGARREQRHLGASVAALRDVGWRARGGEAVSARPTLVVEVPLEGVHCLILLADPFEDELRLRQWLRRSSALEVARLALSCLLDNLDRIDEAA
jgi:hypothetical protein